MAAAVVRVGGRFRFRKAPVAVGGSAVSVSFEGGGKAIHL